MDAPHLPHGGIYPLEIYAMTADGVYLYDPEDINSTLLPRVISEAFPVSRILWAVLRSISLFLPTATR